MSSPRPALSQRRFPLSLRCSNLQNIESVYFGAVNDITAPPFKRRPHFPTGVFHRAGWPRKRPFCSAPSPLLPSFPRAPAQPERRQGFTQNPKYAQISYLSFPRRRLYLRRFDMPGTVPHRLPTSFRAVQPSRRTKLYISSPFYRSRSAISRSCDNYPSCRRSHSKFAYPSPGVLHRAGWPRTGCSALALSFVVPLASCDISTARTTWDTYETDRKLSNLIFELPATCSFPLTPTRLLSRTRSGQNSIFRRRFTGVAVTTRPQYD